MTEKEFKALLAIEGKRLDVKKLTLEAEKNPIWHVADIVGPHKLFSTEDSILFWGTPFSSVRMAVNDTWKRYYQNRDAQHD